MTRSVRGLTASMRLACAAAAVAVTVPVGVAAAAVAAAAPGAPGSPVPPIAVTPTDPTGTLGPPTIGIGVRDDADRGGSSVVPGRRAPSRGGQTCRWVPAPDVEQWIRHLPARLSAGAGPGRVVPVEDSGTGSSAAPIDRQLRLYERLCERSPGHYAWLAPQQPTAAAAPPSPGDLARRAYGQLRLPAPTPKHSPDLRLTDGRAAVLVGEHTWVWTDRSRFAPRARRIQQGSVWATVTAVPVGLSFDPGNGGAVLTCRGPGTVFVPGRYGRHSASPTCDHVYSRSSADAVGGVLTVEYGIRWQVRWTGSTGTALVQGRLPDMTSRARTSFAVAEAQALVTSGS